MIIGLTGTLASGKDVISEYLKEKGFVYFSLSQEVREAAKERKIELTRENLQDLGNQLRKEKGIGALAKLVSEKIKNQNCSNAVIDGIRNPAEVEFLEGIENFSLIAVDAPQEIRFKRFINRNKESDPKTFEEFLKVDSRDQGEGEPEDGQQVRKCMDKAQFILLNDSDLETAYSKINEIYENISKEKPL